MSLFDNIRNKLAFMKIMKDAGPVARDKQVFNLEDAKTVGICFQFTTPEEFDLLKKYVIYLRELKKRVKVLGYYEGKEEPNVQYSKVDYDFVNEKSFNWWGKPADHLVNNFIEEPYDILIDLNMNDAPALQYVVSNSKAHFRIGHYQEGKEEVYDMMISLPKDKGMKAFLREVDTYLQMINRPASTGT